MINTNPILRIKRSAVPGKKPTASQLVLGELGLNTFDANLYTLRNRPGIGIDVVNVGAGATVTNILYVTKDGNDTNTGRKLGDAKATIKGAVAESTAGTVIKVSAGTYVEDNPIVLPNQVSIVGDSLREVTVTPANNDKDLFHIGAGNYIAEMSFIGDENENAIFAFDPNELRYINQSPYIQNCTNFIPRSIGLKVDGNNAIGPLKSMVLDSYTQYNQGGIGASMTNEGYAQLVSLFTICDDVAVYCGTGAACDLTNSNSSFGNFGLIAEDVSPLKFTGVVTSTAAENSDTFTLNLTTPTVAISTAIYDNISGILTAYTATPHEFSVGMGITIVGLGFTCPFEPGIRYYPSGAYGYVFEAKTVAPGRYVDAGNLILANKQEIRDKSLAAIAIYHPDFYFPGDAQTNARSRFFDGYRLIQQNKQEIVDKSLAAVALNYDKYDTFYFPGDSETNARSRYFDAYRLIQKNKDVIVSIAFTNTYNVYPGVATSESKCKRDLGFFIDAISTDVFTGGNSYSRDFTLQYFDGAGVPIFNGLQGEEVQSNYAFAQARDLMKQAITNSLVGAAYSDLTISTGTSTYNGGGTVYSNTDPLSCSDVQSNIDNLVGIVTVTIGAGNTSSLPTPNYGYFNASVGVGTTSSPGGFKCARDLGYLVDAVSTDVFTGGNKYSRDFTKFYFTGATPTGIGSTEREPSVDAFLGLRDYSKKAVTNQLNVKDVGISSGPAVYGGPGIALTVYPSGNPDSCADVQSNIDNLVGIVTVVIGTSDPDYLDTFSENLGTFPSGTSKCYRDLGYAVDAIYKDVRDYTNKNSIEFVKGYFDFNGDPIINGITGEVSESVTAINAVRDYSKKAINNLLNVQNLSLAVDPITNSNQDPLSCANVLTFIDNLAGIITTGIGATVLTVPSVSMASTTFSVNVGIATQPHTYVGGGNAKINVVRPFDGQVVYFGELFYTVGKILVGSGGTGYLNTPVVTISEPETEFGVPAQAVANIANGSITEIEMVSSGRGYTSTPTITITSPDVGINTASATPVMVPTYYAIVSSTLPSPTGICTITVNENVPYEVGVGTATPFFKQSRVLASGHSLEYIGSGTIIEKALPILGGVPIQENETDGRNGGLVVFTSTDQSGNFRIGDGVVVNQATGTISGTFYSKSLFSTLTPFILALGGE